MTGSRVTELEPTSGAVTIRKLGDSDFDREAIARLAERDSREPLRGPALVAEVEGEVLAALSLVDGEMLADPFSRTAELGSLLELRAAQLRRRVSAPRRGGVVVRRQRARAALAASPPGAGGKLIELPRWG